jgi:Abnormal spindle-like microcephaly-assoc'd, ASPM-SPD-2-Hydin
LLAACAASFLFAEAAQGTALTSSPSTVSFGTVAVGAKSTQTLAVKNTSTTGITVTVASITGSGFSISSLPVPFYLGAGSTTFFAVGFTPTSSGTFSGTLTLKDVNSTLVLSVGLSGSGSGSSSGSGNTPRLLMSSPSSVSFGTVPVGNKNTQTLAIKNAGTASLTVSSASVSGTGFSISSLTTPFSLNAGATTYFAVGFKPTASGTVTGTLTLKSNSGATLLAVSLSGSGSGSTGGLTSSTSNLNFGNETVGGSTTLAVTLINNGNSSVTISGVSINGSGFSVTGGISGATVAAGQSAIMNIAFAPKTTGTFNGTVTVVSNAANTAPVIAVTGTGISSTAHSVALSWSPSTSTGVVGYNVYRSTVSGSSYSRVNSSPTTSTKFTDGSVVSEETYYYVVTAVNSSGAESVKSSQITAVIP